MAKKQERQTAKRKQKQARPRGDTASNGPGGHVPGGKPPAWKRPLPKIMMPLLLSGLAVGTLAVLLAAFYKPALSKERVFSVYRAGTDYGQLTIDYPLDETVFPPDIAPATFHWHDSSHASDVWVLTVEFDGEPGRITDLCSGTQWTPSDEQWETIKRESSERPAVVTIIGVNRGSPDDILSAARISISTSSDAVGAPIFYREVHLPFLEAVQDPARHICWRFGDVSSKTQPPVVLESLPNCANCHSFSSDGATLAMEVDSANDKGSYVISPVDEEMVFDNSKIMTWSDFERDEERPTFGLLPQISPDGRYVVCMVKDRSVFVPKPGIEFSQLFFPIRGILAWYDRETKQFGALPGADDPALVQANPAWSPDGKSIVFARTEAYELKNLRNKYSVLLSPDECREFLDGQKLFRFDLYRVPFNHGKGGTPEPLAGASQNGKSNFFPKFSPDGKWIVFCKANSFMLLQPDSELYIIPASGGKARRLRANTSLMNSWHSWSPNSRWLVFSSKANSPFTQLFLTHIDDDGISSPAVLLDRFTSPELAANIPEFVNAKPDAIKHIREEFLNDRSYTRAGYVKLKFQDIKGARGDFEKSLEINPNNANAHFNLAIILIEEQRFDEAIAHCRESLRIEPSYEAHLNLGRVLADTGSPEAGIQHLSEALRLRPGDGIAAYHLALVLEKHGQLAQAVDFYRQALEYRPEFPQALLSLASIRATTPYDELRSGPEAVELAEKARNMQASAWALDVLAAAYAETGRMEEALRTAHEALQLARTAGDEKRVAAIQERIKLYALDRPFRRSTPLDP